MHTVKRVCTLVLTGLLALPMAAPAAVSYTHLTLPTIAEV